MLANHGFHTGNIKSKAIFLIFIQEKEKGWRVDKSNKVVNCDFRLTLRLINFTGHGGTLTKPLLKTAPTAATSATAAAGNNNNSSGKPVKEWYV